MEEDDGYSRFFASMNLFVGSMLTLVLADNLLLLYLGWEGVGLCSYLLIGFWYRDPANGHAAQKAFIVTRVGDAAMALGLFLLVTQLGTLRIDEVMQRAAASWAPGSTVATAAALLLLGGAVGKSAQLPLQTWLPDAMAGPTPVSALIHAATMVTAGVYLIARTHVLFELSPFAMSAVAAVGAATLLLAATSALTQRDIKRVLAYSTISQIGYMFLALGAGAWSAAVFHLMTHAFFKALLFLAAGVVILAFHHEHDIFRMGGLRRTMPLLYWTFLAGAAALAGLPLVTAGFYSKDLILWEAWSSERGSPALWAVGTLGALLTAVYAFRLVFVVFSGDETVRPSHRPGVRMMAPLVVLAILSVVSGAVEIPGALGGVHLFSGFLAPSFEATARAGAAGVGDRGGAPHGEEHGAGAHAEDIGAEAAFAAIAAAVALAGVGVAYVWYRRRTRAEIARADVPVLPPGVQDFWRRGWRFDDLYDLLFVRPFRATASALRSDPADLIASVVEGIARLGYGALRLTQTGRLRWYAGGLFAGTIVVLAAVVLR